MAKLRRNVIANYISQIYAALAGILSVPIYAQYLGIEAFGVIGFYITLQAWFQALDIGLSTTLSRESSLYNADPSRQSIFTRVKSLMEWFFLGTAACAIAIFLLGGEWISINWIKAIHIPPSTIEVVLQLMGIIIAFRWLSCLYRGMITGFELQVWLAKLNIAVTTARFLVPLTLIIYLGVGLVFYFYMQLAVAVTEFLFLYFKIRLQLKSMRDTQIEPAVFVDHKEFQRIRKFAYGVATTSVIWVIITQTDKLVLSKVLPLDEYGRFSMAVTLANGINLVAGPVMMAILPRMTSIAASTDNRSAFIQMYRRLTQLVVTILTPVMIVLTLTAYSSMYAWTGDKELSKSTALILAIYAAGNTVMSIGSVAYALQYSIGHIRMHVIGNIISASIYVPAVIFAAINYGAIGAASVWLVVNLLYLFIWIPNIHRNLVPKINRVWLLSDIGQIFIACCIPAALLLSLNMNLYSLDRMSSFSLIVVLGSVSLLFSSMASTTSRSILKGLCIRTIRTFTGHSS
jgi:O-antigen/teichoic acid export membrane protein